MNQPTKFGPEAQPLFVVDESQLDRNYGPKVAAAILQNLQTKLHPRVADGETAKIYAELFAKSFPDGLCGSGEPPESIKE